MFAVAKCSWFQTLFAENKEKMINGTLAALLDREGDQTSLPADDLEEQFQAMRRLVASKAGFGAFISLPMWVDLWKSLFIYARLL